jgi:uncharacterized membrane protein
MKRTHLLLAWLFTALGVTASVLSLYVHLRLLLDSTYSSFCDVSAAISCSQVYLSAYGSVHGIPVALLGTLGFVVIAMLLGASTVSPPLRENVSGYLFVLSTAALSVVLYLGHAAFFVLRTFCLLCVLTYVAVIGLFLVSAVATPYSMTSLPRRLVADLRALVAAPLALVVAVLLLSGVGAVLGLFPRDVPVRELSAADSRESVDLAEFERWWEEQPRTTIPLPADGAQVLILKFTDYQCPFCAQTHFAYKPVLAKWEEQFPGMVRLVTKHFPLDSSCNDSVMHALHPTACEAHAAGVAAGRAQGAEMEDWLYEIGSAVTPEAIRHALRTVGGVDDFDAVREAALDVVKADVALGRLLDVSSTPTFFLNGVRMHGLHPAALDAAIAIELGKAGVLR